MLSDDLLRWDFTSVVFLQWIFIVARYKFWSVHNVFFIGPRENVLEHVFRDFAGLHHGTVDHLNLLHFLHIWRLSASSHIVFDQPVLFSVECLQVLEQGPEWVFSSGVVVKHKVLNVGHHLSDVLVVLFNPNFDKHFVYNFGLRKSFYLVRDCLVVLPGHFVKYETVSQVGERLVVILKPGLLAHKPSQRVV